MAVEPLSRGWLAAGIGVAAVLAHTAVLIAVASTGQGVAGRETDSPVLVDRVAAGMAKGDADWYARIAAGGYPDPANPEGEPPPEAFAFFPLLPLLMRAGLAVGLPALLTGWLVGLVGAGLATWAITRVADVWSQSSQLRAPGLTAAFLWAFSPGAVALAFPLTEALFTGLAAATMLAVLRERWWWAAGAGALAALTRPTGLAVAVALAVVAAHAVARGRPWRGPLLSTLVVGAAAVAWPLAVGTVLGSPWRGYVDLQRERWESGWDFGYQALAGAVRFARDGTLVAAPFTAVNVLAVLLALVGIVLLVRLRPPLVLAAYGVAATVLVLGARGYLVAKLRLLFPVFPLWYVPAVWLARLDARSRVTVLVGWAVLGLVSTHRILSSWTPAF